MPTYLGKLISGGRELTGDIQIWIQVDKGQGPLDSWSGSFDLPDAKEAVSVFMEHPQCELALADGRRLTIILTRVVRQSLQFQVSGSLA